MRVYLEFLIGSFDCAHAKVEGWGICFLSSLGLDFLLLRLAMSLGTNWVICVDSPFSEYSEKLWEKQTFLNFLSLGVEQGDTIISQNLIDLFMAYEVSHINYGT